MTVIPLAAAKASVLRYLSCVRFQDVIALQGPPLLGAIFSLRDPGSPDLGALATLVVGNVLLMTHVFVLNDWSGLAVDLRDPNKAAGVFTARGVAASEIRTLMTCLLVLSLLFFSWLGPTTLGLALAIATLSALYSLPQFNWKASPILNSGAHLAGGILHFLLGYSLGSVVDFRGVAVAVFFALIFAAGHLTQEIRDHGGDAINGIRTNAVVFGQRRTFAASLVLFTMAQIVFFLLALRGILPRALAAGVALYSVQLHWSRETFRDGFTYASVSRLQARYRALYAVVGLAMVAALYTQ